MVSLRAKHADLEAKLMQLSKVLGPGAFKLADIKRKKLRIRDEISLVERQLQELTSNMHCTSPQMIAA